MNQQDNSKNVILHPHMEEAGILLLEQHLKIANVFLEYGAGGSTFFAAKLNVPHIYSVESDKNFVEKHLKPSNTAGRMAEFIVKPGFSSSLILLDLMSYCSVFT